jgi:diaminohydroxyphosphoribosylaminopyrimidine deaminase/5-amino-6-(5-phosphoribosylamino)uracil reductase
MMHISNDLEGMQRALALAKHALFTTTPNPRVGCILVKNQHIIGEGFTQPAGQNHAEIEALNQAYQKNMDPTDATAYVTLEPCAHTGRTPPCTNALIKAKIKRVVIAAKDPNPLVNGAGIEQLKAAGILVEWGLLEKEARELNIGFFSRMERQRPWVRLKIAASLDGKTALHNGNSQWITSQQARDDGHHWRARACAILTGISTILRDNPHLSVRSISTPRQPKKIVLDSQLRIPLTAHVWEHSPPFIITAVTNTQRYTPFTQLGAEIVALPNEHQQIDLPATMAALGQQGINELHIEAGATLNAALLKSNCVDELLIYLAPNLIGPGKEMFSLPALSDLALKYHLYFHDVCTIGEEIRILARFPHS